MVKQNNKKSDKCVVCLNKANFYIVNQANNLKYYLCSVCGSIFAKNNEIEIDLDKLYKEDYYKHCNNNFDSHRDIYLKNLKDIHFEEYEKMLDKKKCLDIGCAVGNFLELLYERNWEIFGIDRTDIVDKKIKQKGNFYFNDALIAKKEWKNKFDFVNCSHVIEHIAEPEKFVNTLRFYLKPNGRVMIVAPNLGGLQALLDYPANIADPTHLINYSLKGMILLLNRFKFRILNYFTWGGFRSSPIKNELLPLLKKTNTGDVFLVYAEKI